MSAALRQRRSRAAHSLATHERRAQLGWDDLAAWPEWADGADEVSEIDRPAAVAALALRAGAVWHAAALRRCIHGPTLKRLQQCLGDDTLQAVVSATVIDTTVIDTIGGDTAAADTAPLPEPGRVQAWLQAQGAEVMLAALPSPLLRVALRERLWPKALQQLPSPGTQAAAHALQRALLLPLSLSLPWPRSLPTAEAR